MAGPVQKSHGIAALVIGVLEILFGIIIMACSFAVGAKISGQSSISPYWAGIPVSPCYFELLSSNKQGQWLTKPESRVEVQLESSTRSLQLSSTYMQLASIYIRTMENAILASGNH